MKPEYRIWPARPLAILCLITAGAASSSGQVRITLEQAIDMASKHNHNLAAARTTIRQNEAQEVTANLRPNPTLFTDWEYLPLTHPHDTSVLDYLHDSTEGDIGMSYLFERGHKRQHRLQAAKDATSVTRSTVADNERTLAFQVAQFFINVQLAESTLDLADQDLKGFQRTVEISEAQYKSGGASENDFLKIKLQLLQFQQDVQQAGLARAQALSDLRQQLGYESVPADYDIQGSFSYQPLAMNFEELRAMALQNRPDLRAAQQGVTAATSQWQLAKANGRVDVTAGTNYSHVNGISAITFNVSVPLPIFDRNQGEIARTQSSIQQAQEQLAATRGQVLTDVKDAWEALQSNNRIAEYFRSGYLDVSQKNREISEYAYRRGAASLLDFLDSERSYRATQLAWRQTTAAYLTALEQLRAAVGTRSLP